jgi:hypothetical protein
MAHHRRTSLRSADRRLTTTEAQSKSDWLKVTVRPSIAPANSNVSQVTTAHATRVGGRGERPPLFALLQTPERASEVPVEQIPALVAEVASEQAALSAIPGRAYGALVGNAAGERFER